jgi:predicted phosphodiesterase
MKLLILSDLHLEFNHYQLPFELPDPATYDAVVLAGDIGVGIKGMEWANNLFCDILEKEVFYILGNHEFYNHHVENVLAMAAKFAEGKEKFHYLNNNAVFKDDVVFFGGTMWTEMQLPGFRDTDFNMDVVRSRMNDFNVVFKDGKCLKPHHTVGWFYEYVAALKTYSNMKDGRKFVVISHHIPRNMLIAPRWQNNILNVAFAAEVETHGADLWIFGHTHDSVRHDDLEMECDYICNPYGYDGYEVNKNFDPALIVEI